MPWRLLFAHLRRNWFRTLLTAAGVALAVFLLATLRTVLTQVEGTVRGAARNRLIVSSAVSLWVFLPAKVEQELRSMPGVREVTHWTWFGGVYIDEKHMFSRFATDPPTLRRTYGDLGSTHPDLVMSAAEWEAFEDERTACIAGAQLARTYGWKLGDKIEMKGNIFPGQYTFTLRGVYRKGREQIDEATLFFHWKYLHEATGRNDVSIFALDLAPGADLGAVAREVDARFESSDHRTLSLTEAAFNQQFVSMWGNVPVFLAMIGGAVLFAAFMIALNTMLLSARERRLEIGVLKALGFPGRTIAGLLVAEGVLVCGSAGVIGVLAARLLFRPGRFDIFERMFAGFRILDETALLAVGVALLVGLVSGLVPAIVALRTPVVAALARRG